MTDASKLNDFSAALSVAPAGAGAGAPAQSSGATTGSTKTAGSSTGDELSALIEPKLADLEKASGAVGHATTTKVVSFMIENMRRQGKILTAMSKFKKPADMGFISAPV